MYVGVNHVDAFLCYLQISIEKISSMRFRTLPMWLGMGWLAGLQFGCMGSEQTKGVRTAMAKLIEFHVPEHFQPRALDLPEGHRAKVIEFRPRKRDTNATVNYEPLPGSVQRSAVPE